MINLARSPQHMYGRVCASQNALCRYSAVNGKANWISSDRLEKSQWTRRNKNEILLHIFKNSHKRV